MMMLKTQTTLPPDHPLEMLISSKNRDLGGFSVRRLLPYLSHRMVGPFVFFDHMGPADFPPFTGMDVRPHPHIHLATVTYLFEGAIRHHDSLGSDQVIEPGAINLMTAGHGIVHSERTPEPMRTSGGRLNGIQCWIAVPTENEDGPPSFEHYPAGSLPEFQIGAGSYKLLMGSAFGHRSPVRLQSDLFYVEVRLPKGESLHVSDELIHPSREIGLYVVSGRVSVDDVSVENCTMAIVKAGRTLLLTANDDTHLMLIGGVSLGPRFLFWNFVSSSNENINQAKLDYANGPGPAGSRFAQVTGDDQEFIPLPQDTSAPRGTAM